MPNQKMDKKDPLNILGINNNPGIVETPKITEEVEFVAEPANAIPTEENDLVKEAVEDAINDAKEAFLSDVQPKKTGGIIDKPGETIPTAPKKEDVVIVDDYVLESDAVEDQKKAEEAKLLAGQKEKNPAFFKPIGNLDRLVNVGVYSPNKMPEVWKIDESLKTGDITVNDGFRKLTGKFFTKKDNKFKLANPKQDFPIAVDTITAGPWLTSTDKFLEKTQLIRVSFENKLDFAGITSPFGGFVPMLESFIEINKIFVDGIFFHSALIDEEGPDAALPFPIAIATGLVKDEYNFYIEKYEKLLKNVDERLLPNLYIVHSYAESKKTEYADYNKLEDIVSLNGKIKNSEMTMPTAYDTSESKYSNALLSKGQYFDTYSAKINQVFEGVLEDIKNKTTNIVFSSDFLKDKIDSFGDNAFSFPMATHISFKTGVVGKYSATLSNFGYDTNLISFLMDEENKKIDLFAKERLRFSGFSTSNLFAGSAATPGQSTLTSNSTIIDSFPGVVTDTYSFQDWYNYTFLAGKKVDKPLFDDSTFVFENKSKKQEKQSSLYKAISQIVMKKKIDTFLQEDQRTYEEILEGKDCASELLVYRVSKFTGMVPAGGEVSSQVKPIQDFWMTNPEGISDIDFFDTQVFYGKEYTYKIYGYFLVIGAKYEYVDYFINESETKAGMYVKVMPDLKIVRSELFAKTIKIKDANPMPPEVEFVTFKNADSCLRINMTPGFGSATEKYIKILDTELQDEKVIDFESDDNIVGYSVIRLESTPKNIKDFKNGEFFFIKTDISNRTDLKSNSATFNDVLEVNKKYYYTFRAVDVHYHVSNPSTVFEVKVVKNSGVSYTEIKPFYFEDNDDSYIKERHMKHRIKIIPTYLQSQLNIEKSGLEAMKSAADLKKVTLGVKDFSAWGKKVRMRIESKGSGKKVEIDFKFVNRVENNS